VTVTSSPTTAAPASPRPRRAGGEGQWALGHREPLNPSERMKKDDDGLNARLRIEYVYSQRGFASIDPSDLRGRFRWLGLYTQRKPGIDGGKTAILEPHELEDEYFMLRIRIDGGQLNLAQLRAVAHVSTAYGRDTADLTDRQNVQMHWVRIQDVPKIWREIEAVGLSTTEACGDVPRVILGSPVAGISADEVIDATPAINEITERFIGDARYANLPRKFKTSIGWLADLPYEVNDVGFIGAVHPEYGPGFDLWVGGGLSTNPMLAKRLGAWVPLEEIPDVWEGVIGIFRDYGYRRLRSRARLKFLMADWGPEKFRDVLENEYLKRKLVDGPEAVLPPKPVDHIGVHRQNDGKFYVGVAAVAGRVSGTMLARVADIVEAHGGWRVRTTAQQKLIALDIEEDKVESLIAALDAIGLSARPSNWRRSTMACTGIEFCKLAIVETKVAAAELITELEATLADLDVDISVNINGCPNACARTQVADIGLKGQLMVGPTGEQVPGYQIHLGGGLGLSADQKPGFGRKVRGLKTTAEELPAYVSRLARRYAAAREDGESFAEWVIRADEEALR
jgi:sulfite reductase (ferredoxin)